MVYAPQWRTFTILNISNVRPIVNYYFSNLYVFFSIFCRSVGETKECELEKLKGVIIFSGKIHFQFTFLIWVLLQGMCFQDVFINPIPLLLGSVFPDSDHRHAPMGRILPLWLVFNHRGFTHTLPAIVLFSLPIGIFYSWKWCILFAAGYLLHLAMDDSTPMRIKWIRGHKKRAYR